MTVAESEAFASEPMLDEMIFRQMLTILPPARIWELLGILRTRIAELVTLPDEALGQADGLKILHRLVSEAGIMGATPLSRLCAAVETAERAASPGAERAVLTGSLREAASATLARIDRMIAEEGTPAR